MQNSFFQKLVLVILAGALTAGVYEAYRLIVVGGMETVKSGHLKRSEPSPTPRRF